jgi:hypothetical protein
MHNLLIRLIIIKLFTYVLFMKVNNSDLHKVSVQCLQVLCYAVPHDRYTLLLENISLYFVLQQVFFFLYSFIPCFIPWLHF